MCVHSVWPRDRTHKSGFEEGGPFIGETPQATHIILKHNHIRCNKTTVSMVQLSNVAKRRPQIIIHTFLLNHNPTVIYLMDVHTETTHSIAA